MGEVRVDEGMGDVIGEADELGTWGRRTFSGSLELALTGETHSGSSLFFLAIADVLSSSSSFSASSPSSTVIVKRVQGRGADDGYKIRENTLERVLRIAVVINNSKRIILNQIQMIVHFFILVKVRFLDGQLQRQNAPD